MPICALLEATTETLPVACSQQPAASRSRQHSTAVSAPPRKQSNRPQGKADALPRGKQGPAASQMAGACERGAASAVPRLCPGQTYVEQQDLCAVGRPDRHACSWVSKLHNPSVAGGDAGGPSSDIAIQRCRQGSRQQRNQLSSLDCGRPCPSTSPSTGLGGVGRGEGGVSPALLLTPMERQLREKLEARTTWAAGVGGTSSSSSCVRVGAMCADGHTKASSQI